MGDDLQLDILAKVGSVLKGFDQLDERIRKVEQNTRRATKAAQDHQKASTGLFTKLTGNDRSNQPFFPIFTNINETKKALADLPPSIRRIGPVFHDLQQQASNSFLRVRDQIQLTKGVAVSVTPALAGVVAGVTAIALGAVSAFSKVNKAIEDSKAAAASLGATAADQEIETINAIAGLNVDPNAVLETAQTAKGPATQAQINTFLTKVGSDKDIQRILGSTGEGSRLLGTDALTQLIKTFAKNALVPKADETLIEEFKRNGGFSINAAKQALGERTDFIRQQSSGAVLVKEKQREAEITTGIVSRTDTARAEALKSIDRKSIEDIKAVNAARFEATATGRQRFVNRVERVTNIVGEATNAVAGAFGVQSGREQNANNAAAKALSDAEANKPAAVQRVEVVNPPPRPVDNGF